MLQQKGYNHNSLSDSSEQYLYGHNVSTIVLVSYGYCNNLPQIWWFNTRQIYSSTVLEARNPKSVLLVSAKPAPSRSSMGESVYSPFLASGGHLHSLACVKTLALHHSNVLLLVSHLLFPLRSAYLPLFLIRTLVIPLRA